MKEEIGKRLKTLITEKGVTHATIMKEAEISKNVLANYYKGNIPKNIISLATISQLLGTSLDYIIFGKSTGDTDNQTKELMEYYNKLDDKNKKDCRKRNETHV